MTVAGVNAADAILFFGERVTRLVFVLWEWRAATADDVIISVWPIVRV